jgi:hypothetical protein
MPHASRGPRLPSGLAWNAAAGLNAADAWRPLDKHGPVFLGAWALGWRTSETLLVSLGIHPAADVAAARRGAFRGRSGLVNAAVAATGVGGRVAPRAAARASGQVYERALAAELGAGYRRRIAHRGHAGPEVAAAAPGVLRMLRIRGRFAHDRDTSFGPAGKQHVLGISRRADLPADATVVCAELPRAPHAFDTGGTQRATAAAEAVGHYRGVAYGDHLNRSEARTILDDAGERS